jgi:8-oxo-dGTP pyrophosphatase MutT (NUDIX family)
MRPSPLPPVTQALFDPSKPFTPRTLALIRSRLAEVEAAAQGSGRSVDPWTARLKPKGHGAVLAPLLNVADRYVRAWTLVCACSVAECLDVAAFLTCCSPCVLFELRAGHMRQHAGEVAFPGGRVDPVRPVSLAGLSPLMTSWLTDCRFCQSDTSYQDAAARETLEELGVQPAQLTHLGSAGESYVSKAGTMLVHPFVGPSQYSALRARTGRPKLFSDIFGPAQLSFIPSALGRHLLRTTHSLRSISRRSGASLPRYRSCLPCPCQRCSTRIDYGHRRSATSSHAGTLGSAT